MISEKVVSGDGAPSMKEEAVGVECGVRVKGVDMIVKVATVNTMICILRCMQECRWSKGY